MRLLQIVGKYDGITSYLKYVTDNFGIDICINDIAGFLHLDKQLYTLMQPYLIHKNSFCMLIKSDKTSWDRCLRMKRKILQKCLRLKDIYYGACYCGVEEYIVPIICDNAVIGFICAGEFTTCEKLAAYRIRKVANAYNIDRELLENKFKESVKSEKIDKTLVKNLLTIVAEYFSIMYSTLSSTHGKLNAKQTKHLSIESYILSHTIEYIMQNFQDAISVKKIAKFCHCSESYINHIFKKNMKLNISAYINKVRIEKAKELLLKSNTSVTEIALKVGFNDPNYFSSVFSEISGTSPKNFRKMYMA